MKQLLVLASCLFVTCLSAEVSLLSLIENEKQVSIERLENATTEELWDAFLAGQADLFFDMEMNWMANEAYWQQAQNILEIGSGNGSYLFGLATHFADKSFQGIEKLASSVAQAYKLPEKDNLLFHQGDAEVFDERFTDTADLVLFRLTLQHLEKPFLALENAWQYLSENGYVIIIDSCDSAKQGSHPITQIDDALDRVADLQSKNDEKRSRKVTLSILQQLNSESSLSNLYDVVFSNVDEQGNSVHESIRLDDQLKRTQYFNHGLLFLSLIHRVYELPVDLDKAYDELMAFANDEEAWTIPGFHFLVLRKK
ncbi:MAG: methyltransferase domain-containing protein [Chlamydiales bacterium]|nr:methyltransferase domain-containing protein [Chlamydiales bacterium]